MKIQSGVIQTGKTRKRCERVEKPQSTEYNYYTETKDGEYELGLQLFVDHETKKIIATLKGEGVQEIGVGEMQELMEMQVLL